MITNIDQTLLQDLIKLHTSQFRMSPIGAKICAYLKLDFSGEGVTFDQLQEALDVSKGSISLNLRVLIDKGIVLEINKFNDRKTYFSYNPDYIIIWIKESIQRLESNLEIIRRVTELESQKCLKTEEKSQKCLKKRQLHEELIEKGIQNFKEALSKIEAV